MKKRTRSGGPPKIGREQLNVRASDEVITLAERRMHAAKADIAVEDE